MAGQLEKEIATAMVTHYTQAILTTDDSGQLRVPGHVSLDKESARQWLEWCKYPNAPRDEIVDAVRRSFPDAAPAADKGFWVFIDWAGKKFNLDLSSPIVFPPVNVAHAAASS